jgi:FAD/FMN-containing dehydrogenase
MSAPPFELLADRLSGELVTDGMMRKLYATDASEYQEMPAAVAFPKTETDVREIILFAREHSIGIIPRTAGTSLAGQGTSTRSSASTGSPAASGFSQESSATS